MNAMDIALKEARIAAADGEVPVGAVITGPDGAVLVKAHNLTEAARDPMAHAELIVLGVARAMRDQKYLTDCTLTVTLEPCAMCAGAIAALRVGRVVFGAYDPKTGAVEHGARVLSYSHHKPEIIGGVRESDCAGLLRIFFEAKRDA